MPASKIVDEQEVIRWFEEGRTYKWMTEEYLRKYNIETSISMFGAWRRRRGLSRRHNRDDNLIPWHVMPEHRAHYSLAMLRNEARRRAGLPVDERTLSKLDYWLAELREADAVVHYDPDTEEGFHFVPRGDGAPTDLILRPRRATTPRRRAD